MDSRPIGVFDSGLGGLTVVKKIQKLLSSENIIYLGDTARVPYGTRSKSVVTKFSLEDSNFLVKRKVKCIVIACNTASAIASKTIKKQLDVPVFDVITPTIEEISKSPINTIGVIGTRGTINSGVYGLLIRKNNKKVSVYETACPLFVPFIEENESNGGLMDALIDKYLKELKKKKIEMLVLGCTHYPIVREKISKYLGKDVLLLDSGRVTASKLKKYLEENNMLAGKRKKTKYKYFVTDLNERFIKMAKMFLGEDISKKISRVKLV